MDGLPITSTALRWLAGATIIFQLGLLRLVPIPSPVATRRMWTHRGGDKNASKTRGPNDSVAVRWLPVVALIGLLAVIVAIFWPGGGVTLFLPVGARFPGWLALASGFCLLAGNTLIGLAVLALSRHTCFDATGQSRLLVTDGVFGLMQHPIVNGMGLVYLGFFLALPSPLVLVGLGCYGWHQKRRVAAEEVLLEQHFGKSYRDYRRRVGRFWPRWPGGAESA